MNRRELLKQAGPKLDGGWYTIRLDEEQFAWLERDLAATPVDRPVMVLSHAPILSAAVLAVDKQVKDEADLNEQVSYNGVTYISNGAVSGNWWNGRHFRTDNGYAMVNLYDDGSFDNEYFTYGWNG
jgi:Icc protein